MTESFFSLNPSSILISLEREGFRPSGHWTILNSLENRVFDFRMEDGNHVVVKYYRPGRWSFDQIMEEHRFLEDLKEAEIPVVPPLRLKEGATAARDGELIFAVWPAAGGRVPDELNDEELTSLGRFLARIHNAGQGRTFQHRQSFDTFTFGRRPLAFLESHIPPHIYTRYTAAFEAILESYERVQRDIPKIRLHGDCHPGNLLRGDRGFFFLDFDDSMQGPAVQDLWLLVPGRDSFAYGQREILLEGYRTFREFEDHWLDQVEALRAMRYVHYSAWVARRMDDPIFPDTFPDFGTDEYWEEETMDLEEILDRIRRGGGAGGIPGERGHEAPAETEETLTNKDFFWDWEE